MVPSLLRAHHRRTSSWARTWSWLWLPLPSVKRRSPMNAVMRVISTSATGSMASPGTNLMLALPSPAPPAPTPSFAMPLGSRNGGSTPAARRRKLPSWGPDSGPPWGLPWAGPARSESPAVPSSPMRSRTPFANSCRSTRRSPRDARISRSKSASSNAMFPYFIVPPPLLAIVPAHRFHHPAPLP